MSSFLLPAEEERLSLRLLTMQSEIGSSMVELLSSSSFAPLSSRCFPLLDCRILSKRLLSKGV